MEVLKYYSCTVRLYNDKNYTTNIRLADETFRLDFRYNSFSDAYYLTVYDSVGGVIATNKEIAPQRAFNFRVPNGVVLSLYFDKYLDSFGVNNEKWNDNMLCIARYQRWEAVKD